MRGGCWNVQEEWGKQHSGCKGCKCNPAGILRSAAGERNPRRMMCSRLRRLRPGGGLWLQRDRLAHGIRLSGPAAIAVAASLTPKRRLDAAIGYRFTVLD